MPTAGWVALSPQEMRLLKLFTEGHQNKAAAVDTVSLHLRSIYEKLHVRTRSEAVPRALRDGLIH
jgi:DNA-binding CsgD family transcriptional regulator